MKKNFNEGLKNSPDFVGENGPVGFGAKVDDEAPVQRHGAVAVDVDVDAQEYRAPFHHLNRKKQKNLVGFCFK